MSFTLPQTLAVQRVGAGVGGGGVGGGVGRVVASAAQRKPTVPALSYELLKSMYLPMGVGAGDEEGWGAWGNG
jgi:hypothetical protein